MISIKVQTVHNQKTRKVGMLEHFPVVDHVVLSKEAGSSETESDDIVRAVSKRKKEEEEK